MASPSGMALLDQDLAQFGVLVEGWRTGDLGVALHAADRGTRSAGRPADGRPCATPVKEAHRAEPPSAPCRPPRASASAYPARQIRPFLPASEVTALLDEAVRPEPE